MFVGIVYKIWNDVDDKLYVGSTKRSINDRYSHHKYDSKNITRKNYTRPLYVAMRELGVEKFHIECIESVECETKDELHQHEQRHIDDLKPVFNFQKAYLSEQQRKQNQSDWHTKKRETMTDDEKKEATAVARKWRIENQEKSKQYHKDRYQENKEERKVVDKEHYQLNKEVIKARAKAHAKKKKDESINEICDCGGKYKTYSKRHHIKTKKHLKAMLDLDYSSKPKIKNVFTTATVASYIGNMQHLADNIDGAVYNLRRYHAIKIKFKQNNATCLLFTTGKVVCCGTKNSRDAKNTCEEGRQP